MRQIAIFALSLLVYAGVALAEPGAIPLKAPTGYRDYCDGAKAGSRYPCPRGGAPQALWRPLALPTQVSGEPCPVSTPRSVTTRMAPVLGAGLVYFAAGAYNPADRSTMKAQYPATEASVAAGTGWTVAKAPLLMLKTFAQPLVVRGRHIEDLLARCGFPR